METMAPANLSKVIITESASSDCVPVALCPVSKTHSNQGIQGSPLTFLTSPLIPETAQIRRCDGIAIDGKAVVLRHREGSAAQKIKRLSSGVQGLAAKCLRHENKSDDGLTLRNLLAKAGSKVHVCMLAETLWCSVKFWESETTDIYINHLVDGCPKFAAGA